MRLICYIQGGCKFNTIREEWIKPVSSNEFLSLLRFDECFFRLMQHAKNWVQNEKLRSEIETIIPKVNRKQIFLW